MSKIIWTALSLAALSLLISSPEMAANAVRQALDICAGLIIPSLLPFFFISAIISALGIPAALARLSRRPMTFLGLRGEACAPLLMGLLGGYPVGAAALADAVRRGELSPREGERLLPICNNTGPAFIIGVIGSSVFGSGSVGALLYAAHIAAALALALLFSAGGNEAIPKEPPVETFTLARLPECVGRAVGNCINVCGFVIFFSIVSAMLRSAGLLDFLALELSALPHGEVGYSRALLAGILELGSGAVALRGLAPTPRNMALAAFVLGFGSLSVHCQSLAVIEGTDMKCARHFVGRIIHGALSAIFVYFAAQLIKI